MVFVRRFLAVCLGLAPLPALAHPHIFIDAGLTLIRDAAGVVQAVEVTWRYDELYSLIVMEDMGLDSDYDLVLTQDEIDQTLGFDLNWNSGFEGGLVMQQQGVNLDLGAPEPVSLELQTTHRRPVTGAAPVPRTEAQIFDREFYIAFEMILPARVADAPDCTSELIRADLDAAYTALAEAIEEIGGAVAAEDNFPPLGELFADRVVFTCPD